MTSEEKKTARAYSDPSDYPDFTLVDVMFGEPDKTEPGKGKFYTNDKNA